MKQCCLVLALLLLLSGGLVGCGGVESFSDQFYLMDTLIGVTIYTDDADRAEEIFVACRRLLTELDELWSRTKPTSEIARLNASSDGLELADDRTVSLLETALAVSRMTDGAFDVTVTPLVALWARCGEENRLPTAEELASARALVDYAGLILTDLGVQKNDPNMAVDLGGIGKGAAISRLIAYLEETGVVGGLVTFGSNVAVFGEKPSGEPFRIAVKHPRVDGEMLGVIRLLPGEVLSVSGDYERYETIGGKRYHHILDPETGYPADTGLASVAVICSDGAYADALSTALFVMGKERAMALYASGKYDFEAIFADADGNLTVTDGLKQRFERTDSK